MLTTGDDVCDAITVANTVMDEAEVPMEGRYLYITPTLHNAIIAMDSYKSKEMLGRFAKTTLVPSARFYSAIDLLDGKTKEADKDETIGGFQKNAAGENLNFLIIQKNSPIQYTKHTVNKVIAPEANQQSDSWLYFYRIVPGNWHFIGFRAFRYIRAWRASRPCLHQKIRQNMNGSMWTRILSAPISLDISSIIQVDMTTAVNTGGKNWTASGKCATTR